MPEVNDLLDGNSGCHKFGSVSGCLNCSFAFAEPINRSAIEEVDNPCECSASQEVDKENVYKKFLLHKVYCSTSWSHKMH